MSEQWNDLAVAVACRVEFENRCGRVGFIDEHTVVRFAAEFLDAHRTGSIESEIPHPDIKNKFIDLVRHTPRGKQLDLGIEAKWLRPSGSTRAWLKEVAVDLFRLQHFRTGTAQGAHRVLMVVGFQSMLETELFGRKVQTGGGTAAGLPFILPTSKSAHFQSFNLRDCPKEARKWLRSCKGELGLNLPSTYEARLAAQYSTREGPDPVCACVWVTRRKQNWQTFDLKKAWGRP